MNPKKELDIKHYKELIKRCIIYSVLHICILVLLVFYSKINKETLNIITLNQLKF